ncbi:MAG: hypothetical protein KDA21_06635 [Phycisphaerales bacterium]|nr:hypothetical protein [Phycisphaerales bacterium]
MSHHALGALALAAGAFLSSSAIAVPDITLLYIGEGGFSEYETYGPVGGIVAFAFATTSCNRGNSAADWYDTGAQPWRHPVISQTMYRHSNGTMEQIGLAWLKHGFCAVNEPGCATCQSTNCDTLGVGCADTYWGSLNASGLGPRSEINAATGAFPYPFGFSPSGNSTIRGRLQVNTTDIISGANYVLEGHYVALDDASVGNKNNNASYRRVNLNTSNYNISDLSGHLTVEGQSAMYAWKALNPDVEIVNADISSDGRIEVAYRVTDNGNGTWHYEYAIHNLSSDRSVGAVSVDADSAVAVTNVGFHDVFYHSGEPYDGTDWPGSHAGNAVAWSTTPYATNNNANAIRWGTTYNFRFDADQAPTAGTLTLGLFKPGSPADATVNVMVPTTPVPTGCPGDADGNMTVDFDDLNEVLSNWNTAGPAGDVFPFPGGDGMVNFDDLNEVLTNWGTSCP